MNAKKEARAEAGQAIVCTQNHSTSALTTEEIAVAEAHLRRWVRAEKLWSTIELLLDQLSRVASRDDVEAVLKHYIGTSR